MGVIFATGWARRYRCQLLVCTRLGSRQILPCVQLLAERLYPAADELLSCPAVSHG